jgi:nucleoside-diphosphate-sugar epimerase
MAQSERDAFIIAPDDPILVTGSTGFIGARLVASLLDRGCRNVRCFARPSGDVAKVDALARRRPQAGARVEVIRGNLLSREDCAAATAGVAIIFHLAAGTSDKSFPDAFMNTVVTTRNLLEASLEHGCLRRFVNVSSFTVYTNAQKPWRRLLDESCAVEKRPELRGDAYCFAKVKQEELVSEYARKFGIPYVVLRPGAVYGPGHDEITSRVGIATFGVFLHLGGSNQVPLTYVDNCAEAILLAGLKKDVNGEAFNIVDDDLPSSRRFLRLYKQNVRPFKSIYLPHVLSHALCYLWETYSAWSEGQLPPVFNRRKWRSLWKKTRYSNEKLKSRLGWTPKVPMTEGLNRYFQSCRERERSA